MIPMTMGLVFAWFQGKLGVHDNYYDSTFGFYDGSQQQPWTLLSRLFHKKRPTDNEKYKVKYFHFDNMYEFLGLIFADSKPDLIIMPPLLCC